MTLSRIRSLVRFQPLFLIGVMLSLMLFDQVKEATGLDKVPAAPAEEAFVSPSGSYVFVLHAPEDGDEKSSEGELRRKEGADETSLWRRALPHQYRARTALVNDHGRVVMFDEWWNIKSAFAVVVLDAEGRDITIKDYVAVRDTMGETDRSMVAQAARGWWISAPPRLDPSGDRALVETAGKTLVVDLEDGRLSAQP